VHDLLTASHRLPGMAFGGGNGPSGQRRLEGREVLSKIQFEIAPMPEIADFPSRQPRGRPANSRNSSLDGLRGIAVLLTFLVHFCGTYMSSFRGANPNFVALAGWHGGFDTIMYWLFRSHHGVYIFFMLSGYLIAKLSLSKDFSYFRFLRNRLVRIYPAFLLALGACMALAAAAGRPLPGWRDIVFNLLFLNGFPPAHVDGIVFNNVTWSLFYEMIFYFVFPVVLMLARLLRLPVPAAIAIAGILASYGPAHWGFHSELFLFLFAGAIAGTLPAAQFKTAATGFPDAIVIGIYGLVTGLLTLDCITTGQFVWLFACLGLLVIGKAVSGEGVLARSLAWRPLVGLGRISYSFYLLHSVSLALVFRLWARLSIPSLGLVGNALYLGLLGFAGAVVLGWGSFLVAERFYFKHKEAREHRDMPAGVGA
jgi:peptidoglycan/LPS O-acetylase OafA/YrhL